MANLFIATLLMLNFSFVKAQQFKFHAEYEPSWYGPGFNMEPDIPGYVKTTLMASSADEQFVIEADNGFNRWKKNGLTLTTNINEVDLNMLINLFPNPSNISLINISNNSTVKIIEANVYDVQGKLILNKLQNNITQINFADDIARQVLILQLKFENNTIVYKRIVLN